MNEIFVRALFTLLYLAIDLAYITFQKGVYADAVLRTQKTDMTVYPMYAIVSYTVLLGGWFFLVVPAVMNDPNKSLRMAAWYGMWYGLAVYGTFACTNAAILKEWKGRVVIQDILWGTSASIVMTVLYATILHRGNFKLS